MKTWNDCREHIQEVDPQASKSIEEVEKASQIAKDLSDVAFNKAIGIAVNLIKMDVLSKDQIIEATELPETLIAFLIENKEAL